MLHEIDEVRVYCGPAALMAVTGKRLPEVRSAINKARGFNDNQGVLGLSTTHLEKALHILGVKFCKECYPHRITLKEFKNHMVIGMPHILAFNTHYVTVEDGQLIDNHYRFGTPIDESKWKNKQVQTVWRILQ